MRPIRSPFLLCILALTLALLVACGGTPPLPEDLTPPPVVLELPTPENPIVESESEEGGTTIYLPSTGGSRV